MKYFFYIFIFLIISCQSGEIIDNQPQIDKIDSLTVSEIIYEVSINKFGEITDTVSIEKKKYNKNNILLYSYYESFRDNYIKITENYYRDNKDMFIQKTGSEKLDIYSEYTTYVNKNLVIVKSEMNDNTGFNITMDYNYKYGFFGTKKSLTILSKIDSLSSRNYSQYNDNEDILFNYNIINNDTIEKATYQYNKDKLVESKYYYLKRGMIVISGYDEQGRNTSKKIMELIDGKKTLTQEVIFKLDLQGNLISKEKTDFIKDTTYISKFITEKVKQINN
jgi:ribosomal protein S18